MSNVLISAGDVSGELYARQLSTALLEADPALSIYAAAGESLAGERIHRLMDLSQRAPIGITEAVGAFSFYWKCLRKMEALFEERSIQGVILIDFPDFNFRVARLAKRYGLPVFYYIAPQLWAWRPGRIHFMKKYVDQLFVIFPFEESWFGERGVKAKYVGHPMVEIIQEEEKNQGGRSSRESPNRGPVVGLFPGSRLSTFRRLFPLLLETAQLLQRRIPSIQFLLSLSGLIPEKELEHRYPKELSELKLEIIYHKSRDIIRRSDLVLTPTGTITMEAFFLETPGMAVNRVSLISWLIGKGLVKVPYLSMPNLLAGEELIPEFIQYGAKSDRIASCALNYLENSQAREEFRAKGRVLREKIIADSQDVSRRVAQDILASL